MTGHGGGETERLVPGGGGGVEEEGESNGTSGRYGSAGLGTSMDSELARSGRKRAEGGDRGRRTSMQLMYVTTFISSLTYTVCVSSVWPYLQQVDASATLSFLGWVVASYSLGQLVANPSASLLATCGGSVRLPLLATVAVNAGGSLLYAYIPLLTPGARYYMLLARILVGVGSGNIGLIRGYVGQATSVQERAGAMSFIGATQCIGFVLGPAFQAALTPLGYPGYHIPYLKLSVDMYTSAGVLSLFLSLINLLALAFFFREYVMTSSGPRLKKDVKQHEMSPLPKAQDQRNLGKLDVHALVTCNIVFFVIMFVFTVLETIGTPFTMIMYDWGSSEAITNNGIIFTVLGVEALVVMLSIKFLAAKFSERSLLLSSFILILLGYLVILPWGNHYPNFQTAVIDTNSSSSSAVINTTSVPTVEPKGCPLADSWCWDTPGVYLGQFLASVALVGCGYPAAQVMLLTLYSKLLGGRNQNIAMGIISSLGSLSRTLGPVFVGNIFDTLGARWTFAIIAGIILITIIYLIFMYRRLSCTPSSTLHATIDCHSHKDEGVRQNTVAINS